MAPRATQRSFGRAAATSTSWAVLAQELVNAVFRARTPRNTGDEKEVPLQTFTPEVMLRDMPRPLRRSWDGTGSEGAQASASSHQSTLPPAPLSEHDERLGQASAEAGSQGAAELTGVDAGTHSVDGVDAAWSREETVLTMQRDALSQLCLDFLTTSGLVAGHEEATGEAHHAGLSWHGDGRQAHAGHPEAQGALPTCVPGEGPTHMQATARDQAQQGQAQHSEPQLVRPLAALTALCRDGNVASKLLNVFVPGAVDERALNTPHSLPASTPTASANLRGSNSVTSACTSHRCSLSREAASENLVLAHASALSVGFRLEGVDRQLLTAGQDDALLALVAGIICNGVLQSVPAAARAWEQQHPQHLQQQAQQLLLAADRDDVDEQDVAGHEGVDYSVDTGSWLKVWAAQLLSTPPVADDAALTASVHGQEEGVACSSGAATLASTPAGAAAATAASFAGAVAEEAVNPGTAHTAASTAENHRHTDVTGSYHMTAGTVLNGHRSSHTSALPQESFPPVSPTSQGRGGHSECRTVALSAPTASMPALPGLPQLELLVSGLVNQRLGEEKANEVRHVLVSGVWSGAIAAVDDLAQEVQGEDQAERLCMLLQRLEAASATSATPAADAADAQQLSPFARSSSLPWPSSPGPNASGLSASADALNSGQSQGQGGDPVASASSQLPRMFRLAAAHLHGSSPQVLLLCLAAALKASVGQPLWVAPQHSPNLDFETEFERGLAQSQRGAQAQERPGVSGTEALVGYELGVILDESLSVEEGVSAVGPEGAASAVGDEATDVDSSGSPDAPLSPSPDGTPSLPQPLGPSLGDATSSLDRSLTSSRSMPAPRRTSRTASCRGPVLPRDGDLSWVLRQRDGASERGLQLRSCAMKVQKPKQETKTRQSFGSGLHDPVIDPEEERLLRLWLNSLDPRIQLPSLYSREMRTGWPLLLALDAIQPGCVAWGRVFPLPFKDKVHQIMGVCNCNMVVAVCRSWQLPLVNIGGIDIAQGRHMTILSLVWQLMRHHLKLQLLPASALPVPAPLASAMSVAPTVVPSSTTQTPRNATQGSARAPDQRAGVGSAEHEGTMEASSVRRGGSVDRSVDGGAVQLVSARAVAVLSERRAPGWAAGVSIAGGGWSGLGSGPGPGLSPGLGSATSSLQLEVLVLRWLNDKLVGAGYGTSSRSSGGGLGGMAAGTGSGVNIPRDTISNTSAITTDRMAAADEAGAMAATVGVGTQPEVAGSSGGGPAAGPGLSAASGSDAGPGADMTGGIRAPGSIGAAGRAGGSTGGICIRSFEDHRLTDTKLLLDLLATIAPGAVNPRHVLPGTTAHEREANARYLLSLAHKLGCKVFLLWQDLLQGGAQRSLILLASLMALDLRLSHCAS